MGRSRGFSILPNGKRITLLVALAIVLVMLVFGLEAARTRRSDCGIRGGKASYYVDVYVLGKVTDGPRALERARQKVAGGDAQPFDYYVVARWEYLYGRRSRALAVLRRGCNLFPKDRTCFDLLATILIVEGKVSQLGSERPMWLEADWAYYEDIGNIQLRVGRSHDAQRSYEKALSLLREQEGFLKRLIEVPPHMSEDTSPTRKADSIQRSSVPAEIIASLSRKDIELDDRIHHLRQQTDLPSVKPWSLQDLGRQLLDGPGIRK